MSQHERERRESALQEAALRQPSPADVGEPAIAQYRMVYRAVREAPMPPLPADLATALARAVRYRSDLQARARTWSSLWAVGLLMALLASALAAQWQAVASALPPGLAAGPWRTLAAAGIAIALFALLERAWPVAPPSTGGAPRG